MANSAQARQIGLMVRQAVLDVVLDYSRTMLVPIASPTVQAGFAGRRASQVHLYLRRWEQLHRLALVSVDYAMNWWFDAELRPHMPCSACGMSGTVHPPRVWIGGAIQPAYVSIERAYLHGSGAWACSTPDCRMQARVNVFNWLRENSP